MTKITGRATYWVDGSRWKYHTSNYSEALHEAFRALREDSETIGLRAYNGDGVLVYHKTGLTADDIADDQNT